MLAGGGRGRRGGYLHKLGRLSITDLWCCRCQYRAGKGGMTVGGEYASKLRPRGDRWQRRLTCSLASYPLPAAGSALGLEVRIPITDRSCGYRGNMSVSYTCDEMGKVAYMKLCHPPTAGPVLHFLHLRRPEHKRKTRLPEGNMSVSCECEEMGREAYISLSSISCVNSSISTTLFARQVRGQDRTVRRIC